MTNKKRMLSALRQVHIEDEEILAVLSEASRQFDDQTINGLIDLVRRFGEAQEADNRQMEDELAKTIKKYKQKIIIGRRRGLRKAMTHYQSQLEKEKIKTVRVKIKHKFDE